MNPRRQPILSLALAALVCAVLVLAAGAPVAASQQAADRAEGMYLDAAGALTAGDTDTALQLLSTIVSEYPRARYPDLLWRAAAGVRAGEIELRLGRDQAAASRFLSVIEGETPSGATSRARYGLATTLIWAGEWRAAVNTLQSIVTAADSGSDHVDLFVAALARERLDMAHRLWLRPSAGRLPWTRAGRYTAAPDLDRPVGVATSETGEVLITDEGLRAAVFIDSGGNAASIPLQDSQRPWWSPSGSAYVATEEAVAAPLLGESYQFAVPDGGRIRPLRGIRAGVRGAAGEWVLVDDRSDSVGVFSPAGDYITTLDLGPRGEPVDIAADQRGQVYVIEKGTRTVLVFAPDGTRQNGFGLDTWREPYAVAVDAAGNVYVLDRGAKRITVFDAAGGIRWSLGPVLPGGVELRDPRDLAVDGAGRILIADRGLSSIVIVE